MRLALASPAASAVIDSARIWRAARDLGQPVQPILYARLERLGSGILAPVLDALLTLFEACFRRRFDAGDSADAALTGDERQLLNLLDRDCPAAPIAQVRPELALALRTALRSTRIMLGTVLGLAPDGTMARAPRADDRPSDEPALNWQRQLAIGIAWRRHQLRADPAGQRIDRPQPLAR